jgi:PAS domain S-box-containing protein
MAAGGLRAGGAPTILAVDDDPRVLLQLTTMLEEEGYQVRRAGGGRLALASIAAAPPDLILLDVRMPEMDGFEVCRRLKADKDTEDIPLIFLSTSIETEQLEGLTLGAADFISKPFRRLEVLSRVRTHLELGLLRDDVEAQVTRRTEALHAAVLQLEREVASHLHAERTPRDAEERLRAIVDAAPALIWVAAANRLCTFFNKTWLAFTGRSMEQEVGNGWADGIHPEDRDHCLDAYVSAFSTARDFQLEHRLRRADGQYRWMLNQGSPRFDENGVFAGYVGSCVDITDFRQEQEESFDRDRLEGLRILIGGIAHDHSNLMGAILATAELAQAAIREGGSARQEIQTIKTVASQASDIARELMMYAWQDRGNLEPVDVAQVMEDMLKLLERMISTRTIVKRRLPEDLPAVWGNPTHIRQIVMNLVVNASDALGGNGEIEVSASYRPRIPGSPASDYLRIEVSDTGCGMTEEQKARVLDPFFTTKGTGRGLGLAVVHRIVQSHHGVLKVASGVGMGTQVEVLLPWARVAHDSARAADRQHP